MATVLNIELTYFEGSKEKYQFLRDYLTDSLNQLDIIPELHISDYPLPPSYIKAISVDSVLSGTMNYVLRESHIKPTSDRLNQWYICVIIAFKYIDDYLGLMFDHSFTSYSRNGCAVFEESIRDFSHKEGVDYERIFARTLLHEIGHCLNFPHDKEIKLMSPTFELMSSHRLPRWNKNIVYEFSEANWKYIEQEPGLAKPGGRLDFEVILREEEVSFGDSTKGFGKSLKLTLKNCDLDAIPAFEVGSNVSLMLELENISLRSIRIPLSLNQNDENFKISIINPEGTSIPYRKPVLGCGSSLKSVLIYPGERRLISLNLFFDSNGYLFPTAGTYLISCSIRKFGKQNIWYTSDTEELVLTEISLEKNLLFNKLFNSSFRKYFLRGGGYSQGFLRKCKSYLKDSFVHEHGFSVPIAWIYLHSLKNMLIQETKASLLNSLKKKLMNVYSQLIQEEKSRIRRGKISYEMQHLIASTKFATEKYSDLLQNKNQEEYLNFKKIHISRIYAPLIKAKYEDKILR